jgi:hypothetical protein
MAIRLRLPTPFYIGGQPLIEVLKSITNAWPRTMFREPEKPDQPSRTIENLVAMVEADLASSEMPKRIKKAMNRAMFFWAFDDLGFIRVLTTDAPRGALGVVFQEDEQYGLPIGR